MKGKVLNALKNTGIVLIHIAVLGLIPLDLYIMNIDEIAALVLTIVWLIIVNAAFIIRRKKIGRKPGKTGVLLFAALDLITILIMTAATQLNIYWNSDAYRDYAWNEETGNRVLTKEQALKDYEFAMKYLKKIHPLTLHGLPADVEAQAEKVRQDIESMDRIAGYEFCRKLAGIYSLLGDGHTNISENYLEPHYMKHIYEHKTVGDTLVAVNGVTFEEMLKQKPGYVSYDTEDYGIRMLKNRISTLEGLRYLDIDTSGDIIYNYVTKAGDHTDVVVTADDFLVMEEYLDYEESVTGEDLRSDDGDYDFVSYEIDEEKSLAVFTLDNCTYNRHYREVVEAMFEEIHEKDIQNVAVDLRNNSGGSSLVADEFIRYLDVDEIKGWADETRLGPIYIKSDAKVEKNRKKGYGFSGNIYVITSVYTYSSAIDFAMLIQDNGLGKVVGEASGNLPASYGEVSGFLLPESHIYFQISSKKWHRIDESKENLQILPDIECDPDEAYNEICKDIID
ncbi:MAG: hypothetical protein IJ796_10325 [Lachnospiraceae bacterium]|nr:hypothetical protein [Lachnospiraceae bacterium]